MVLLEGRGGRDRAGGGGRQFDRDGCVGRDFDQLGDDKFGAIVGFLQNPLVAGGGGDAFEGFLLGQGLQCGSGVWPESKEAAIVVIHIRSGHIDFAVEQLGGREPHDETIALGLNIGSFDLTQIDARSYLAIGQIEQLRTADDEAGDVGILLSRHHGFHRENSGGEFAGILNLLNDDRSHIDLRLGLTFTKPAQHIAKKLIAPFPNAHQDDRAQHHRTTDPH